MKILLDHLIPYSLKDSITNTSSAIWNQSVCFENSDFIKIEAPSGTGKTTLTHFLYSVRQDYSGKIQFENKQLKHLNADELAALRSNNLSIVFQDLSLFSNLTARENIEIKRLRHPKFQSENTVLAMANELGIAKILDQKICYCSLGEQQRVAIIRAMMQPFNWLLLDEPFSHLDKKNIEICTGLIETVTKQNNAGIIIMGLNQDDYFNYSRALQL